MQRPKCSAETDEVHSLDVVIDARFLCEGIWLNDMLAIFD